MWRLPEDIEVDIFLRLPVNSILACRCVCKPFLNLLSKPCFINNHLTHSIQTNNHNPRLMYGQYDKKHPMMIYSLDYASSDPTVSHLDYPFENNKKTINIKSIVTLGSCNGLICLGITGDGIGVDQENWICIWNPSTGGYKNIKLQRLSEFQGGVRYGFGYDSVIHDYKLVRISSEEYSFDNKIEVYTLRSKCWKTIESTDRYMLVSRLHKCLHGVLVNGSLHWYGVDRSKVIVCFDINNETLKGIPLPEEPLLPLDDWRLYIDVGVFGDCLSVVFSNIRIQTDVWVMQYYGVRESWIKVFTTSHLAVTKDPFLKLILSFDNGDILVYADEQLSLCNRLDGKRRKVLVRGINMSRYPEIYVESLVSLESSTYVKKSTTRKQK